MRDDRAVRPHREHDPAEGSTEDGRDLGRFGQSGHDPPLLQAREEQGGTGDRLQEPVHPVVRDEPGRARVNGDEGPRRPRARDKPGETGRPGRVQQCVPGEMEHGGAREHLVRDIRRIQLGIGTALGQHGAVSTVHDDDDRAGRQRRVSAEMGCHTRGLEQSGVPLVVARSHDPHEIDGRTERTEPGRGVGGGPPGPEPDGGRGVGVGSDGAVRHGDDVVDDIAECHDAGFRHPEQPTPWRSRLRPAHCCGPGRG